MKSFFTLVLVCTVLASAKADDKEIDVHKTTIRVTPGVLAKILGIKPEVISIDGNQGQRQARPTKVEFYPIYSDNPQPGPVQGPQQPDEYTFLGKPQAYPRPYPVPYPQPYPQPYPKPYPPPIILPYPQPYPQYPVYPPVYPRPSYYPYPQYPQYPFPGQYPGQYPGYPPYPFGLAEESSPQQQQQQLQQTQEQESISITNPALPESIARADGAAPIVKEPETKV